MDKKSFEHQDIVRMLSELKSEAPEYPSEMMSARKSAFLKKAADIKISKEDKGGQGGTIGGSGRSGGPAAASGGGATFFGFSLKTVLTVGFAVAALTGGYLFRDQIRDVLVENEIISTEEPATPLAVSQPEILVPATPTAIFVPTFAVPDSGSSASSRPEATPVIPTFGAPELGSEATPVIPRFNDITPGNNSGRPQGTATPQAQDGPFNFIQYLMCILRGGENCQ